MKLTRRGQATNQYGSDEEQIIVSGNPRHAPGVKLFYFNLEDSPAEDGRILFEVCHDCEDMTIDHFEAFIASFRKLIEIARRKAQPWELTEKGTRGYDAMPQVEMNYNSQALTPSPITYMLHDWDGPFSIPTAERFADMMDRLLTEGRTLEAIERDHEEKGGNA